MSTVRISVVICTRNPRDRFLERVLGALASQSLPVSDWELVVVDNGSDPAVETRGFRLPPNGRVVVEAKPGLTSARTRGIRETIGAVIVFVDDDNVLAADYLENATAIGDEFPRIGVWGGRLLPEFEGSPESWMKPHWKNLALVDFDRDRWTNDADFSVFPPGAGMCVRRSIANDYAARLETDPLRLQLDRVGGALGSGGDTDLVLQTIDAGWGVGQFARLSLVHLIPKERLTLDYHKRLAEGISRSAGQLSAARSESKPNLLRHRLRGFLGILRARGPARAIAAAGARGWITGLREGWEARRGAVH